MPRREDDDRDPPRRAKGGGGPSTVTVVLAVLGGLFVLAVVACGGLIFLGKRTADRAMAEMKVEMEAAEREAAEADRARERDPRRDDDPDRLPAPADGKPVPQDPKQPAPTAFDGPGDAGRWFVLFRGTDPAKWNTETADESGFALPVRCAPAKMRYLRLRRTDTGDSIFIPLTRKQLADAQKAEGAAPRWNGENRDEHGGRHLGIGHGKRAEFMQGKGLIAVVMDGWDATTGSGFGHAHHGEEGGQRQVWKGEEVKGVPFEIAVTTGALTEKEKAQLLK